MSNFASLMTVLWASVACAQLVPYSAETLPIPSTGIGDVAVFPNPVNPKQSRVIGTDFISNGLFSFAFDGGTSQFVSLGPMRGVDVKTGLRFRYAPSAVLVASSVNAGIFVYGLDDGGTLYDVSSRFVTVGGFGAVALWAVPDGGLEAWLDVGSTTLKRVAFFDDPLDAGKLDWAAVDASVTFPKPVNALVVDSVNRRLYASVTTDGIYRWDIDSLDGGEPVLVEGLESADAGALTAAPAGLSLYPLRDGGSLVFVAQPNRDQFAVYAATKNGFSPLTTFQVGIDPKVVRNGAYLDVSRVPVPEYPLGVVAFADRNLTSGATYKLVGWDILAASVSPKLPIEDGGPGDAGVDSGVFLETCPDDPDGGLDGGSTDGGTADGGVDGGANDAGPIDAGRPCIRRDAGVGQGDGGFKFDGGPTTGDGGGLGPSGGGAGGGDPGGGSGCGCGVAGLGSILPALVVLLFTRGARRRENADS